MKLIVAVSAAAMLAAIAAPVAARPLLAQTEASRQADNPALASVLADPARLEAMSLGARSTALPDATRSLADMVEATAR